jgi:hypothetical protein
VSASPQGVIVLSGRIEGDEAAVAPKLGGRILEVRVLQAGCSQQSLDLVPQAIEAVEKDAEIVCGQRHRRRGDRVGACDARCQ